MRAEYETKLNRVSLHIYVPGHYEEDYQMPMLRQNHIPGILDVEGCEVEGKSRYTYEINGMVSMKTVHEKSWIKKAEILDLVSALLEVSGELQRYMLNPDCLVLKPEYIFYKNEKWFFCYLPGMKEDLRQSFHELTEYFVKTLDYEDTEGIFLAYELHKATLQENYDLEQIMKDYEAHEEDRSRSMEEWNERHRKHENYRNESFGNVFTLTEEEEGDEVEQDYKAQGEYEVPQRTDFICEESGWRKPWKKAANLVRRKRWGNWNDLIMETDGQEEHSAL